MLVTRYIKKLVIVTMCLAITACSQSDNRENVKQQGKQEQPQEEVQNSREPKLGKSNEVIEKINKIDSLKGSSEIDETEDFLGKLQLEHAENNWAGGKGKFSVLTGSQVNLVVDGVTLNLDPRPIIDNGSTLIPIRAISTHFGAGVWWNAESRTVGINKGELSISFAVGSSAARVNGAQVVIPPSRIINNSTFVPIRFISETFGYTVGWNSQTRTVTVETTPSTYTVVAGDTLTKIAARFGMTVEELRRLNKLESDIIRVGQTLVVSGNAVTESIPVPDQTKTIHYTVVSGDSLSRIAARFSTTVEAIRATNNLTSDQIFVNQVLQIPTSSDFVPPATNTGGVTKTFTTHTVQSGDNAWNLSIKYGIPMLELLQTNNLSLNSSLQVGQRLTVPVYHVPVKQVVSSRHGELLDWWTEARYVFPIGKEATVTDFQTGKTFRIRHTMGGNHADCEPLTAADAEIMRQLWGGNYSWTPRAVILTVDGRRLAAAMHCYPHGDHVIKSNNYAGHFCVHFLNSTRHNDGLVQASMQSQIKLAAGVN